MAGVENVGESTNENLGWENFLELEKYLNATMKAMKILNMIEERNNFYKLSLRLKNL